MPEGVVHSYRNAGHLDPQLRQESVRHGTPAAVMGNQYELCGRQPIGLQHVGLSVSGKQHIDTAHTQGGDQRAAVQLVTGWRAGPIRPGLVPVRTQVGARGQRTALGRRPL